MDEHSQKEPARGAMWLWVLIAGLVALVLLSALLGRFDDATELAPTHNDVDLGIFYIAGISGLVCGVVSVYLSRGMVIWRRIGIALSVVFLGLLAGFTITYQSADMIEQIRDFPAAKTKTYPALLLISRAYATHGKGDSWNIQTMPLWSNLEITQSDYNFMLARRADDSRNPDEISSRGYFCARVTMQSAGDALRILHAGNRKLPKGTVVICPQGGN